MGAKVGKKNHFVVGQLMRKGWHIVVRIFATITVLGMWENRNPGSGKEIHKGRWEDRRENNSVLQNFT